jgi:hypothetical protein
LCARAARGPTAARIESDGHASVTPTLTMITDANSTAAGEPHRSLK